MAVSLICAETEQRHRSLLRNFGQPLQLVSFSTIRQFLAIPFGEFRPLQRFVLVFLQ